MGLINIIKTFLPTFNQHHFRLTLATSKFFIGNAGNQTQVSWVRKQVYETLCYAIHSDSQMTLSFVTSFDASDFIKS